MYTKKSYGIDETTKTNKNLPQEEYVSKVKEIIINLAKKHKHFDSERGLIKLLTQESEIEEEITNQKPKLDFKKEIIQLKKKRVIKNKPRKRSGRGKESESESEEESKNESSVLSHQELEELRIEIFEAVELNLDRTKALEEENRKLKERIQELETEFKSLSYKVLLLSGPAHDYSERNINH